MMNPVPLFDNPLFLKNWRMNTRPKELGVETLAIVLALFVMVPLFRNSRWSDAQSLTLSIMVVQCVLLLILAPYKISTGVIAEGQKGTLDFHRTSPTRITDQLIGLIFGPGVLEWIIAGILLVPLCAFALMADVPVKILCLYVPSLCMTSVLMGSAFSLAGFDGRYRSRATRSSSAALVGLVGLGFAFAALLNVNIHSSFGGCIVGITGPAGLVLSMGGMDDSRFISNHPWQFLGMQAALQLPLIVLFWAGIRRAFKKPEGFLISKRMIVALCAIFILDAALIYITDIARMSNRIDQENIALILLFMGTEVLGFLCAALCTPNGFQYSRALVRCAKTGGTTPRWFEDGAPVPAVFLICASICTTGMGLFLGVEWIKVDNFVLTGFLILWMTCGWFAMSYQWVQLRWGKKGLPFYAIALVMVWLVLPVLFAVLSEGVEAWAISPFACYMVGMVNITNQVEKGSTIILSLASNAMLCAVFSYLVWAELRRIRQSLLQTQ